MKTRIFALLLAMFCWLDATAAVTLGNQASYYPRMIRLAANGAANNRLIASFDYGNTKSTIWESTNNGTSWNQIATINLPEPGHCCSGLYEVPQALGGTPKGALLWTTSTTNGGAHAIRIYRSTDQGHSWSLL
jgi:hypothetical protein